MRKRIITWAVVALLGLATPALADELVHFAAASPSTANGAGIDGYLTRPKGSGPFPAVIVLHSCLGLRADRAALAGTLADWGYVSLFVDDFTTRGLKETCSVDFPEALGDAFGALAFLGRLPGVDPGRIASLGYSQGAATALEIAARGSASGFALPPGLRFAAAAAFYPACDVVAGARLRLPTLVLVGAADTVTPAAPCRALAARQASGAMRLVVYPGAGHVFDDPQFAGGKSLLGMWLQYDAGAAKQSRAALKGFLRTALAR